ncbi:Repeat domain-containing protein [Malonomonas rubra DSM 5091]|uniref:Repeat domain-containing protein n=1 Tax=Malonomonas rubra DSM 5091 TaxID=1122189 RepID=A0A1M6IVZ1_MALRU|nr:VCBS repeat-containing protein [Malonomonas rubra]SHJ38582.1 Repeat domain-containing protein [Malonomonas rubra DSM 5091]
MSFSKQSTIRRPETTASRRSRPFFFWLSRTLAGYLITLAFLFPANASDVKLATDRTLTALKADKAVIRALTDEFSQLPEKQISVSEDGAVYAQYSQPTTRYQHGILGDAIEAGQLIVARNGTFYKHTLAEQYVFEDIKPRLFDVDNDGQMEIVTIRSHIKKGAGIMIYKIENDALTEFAWIEEIGTASRWLNIAAIYDLDGDGRVEMAWIQTPHIGGILKVARIRPGKLVALSESSPYSNHSIGERNLCLSLVAQEENATLLYVPAQNRRQIVGFQLKDNTMKKIKTISQPVNFSTPLVRQHNFSKVVQSGVSCPEF